MNGTLVAVPAPAPTEIFEKVAFSVDLLAEGLVDVTVIGVTESAVVMSASKQVPVIVFEVVALLSTKVEISGASVAPLTCTPNVKVRLTGPEVGAHLGRPTRMRALNFATPDGPGRSTKKAEPVNPCSTSLKVVVGPGLGIGKVLIDGHPWPPNNTLFAGTLGPGTGVTLTHSKLSRMVPGA